MMMATTRTVRVMVGRRRNDCDLSAVYFDVDGNLFDVASPPTINEARYLGCNHHVAASFNISSLTVGQ